MTLIYLLSDYEEHGSENMVATTDRDKVADLLRAFQNGVYFDEAREKLEQVLADKSIVEARDPISLLPGWGGVQLHIVPVSK